MHSLLRLERLLDVFELQLQRRELLFEFGALGLCHNREAMFTRDDVELRNSECAYPERLLQSFELIA